MELCLSGLCVFVCGRLSFVCFVLCVGVLCV